MSARRGRDPRYIPRDLLCLQAPGTWPLHPRLPLKRSADPGGAYDEFGVVTAPLPENGSVRVERTDGGLPRLFHYPHVDAMFDDGWLVDQ